MFYLRALFILTACLLGSHCKVDYCAFEERHTMCVYTGLGKNCVNPGASGVSRAERKEIVDAHNWLRRKVAAGEETRGVGGSQPKASKMLKITWDKELSRVAQRWADQCTFRHDGFRNDTRWSGVGQNLYITNARTLKWRSTIISWFDEVSNVTLEELKEFSGGSKSNGVIGHYTQVVWDETYMVGCGKREYGGGILCVCNYGPGGNIYSRPVYDIGAPCSKCPAGTSCDNSLCGESVDESSEENLEPPKGRSENSSEGLDTKLRSIQNQTQARWLWFPTENLHASCTPGLHFDCFDCHWGCLHSLDLHSIFKITSCHC